VEEQTRPPFKGFHNSPEIIRLAVMLCIRFPLSARNVEDLILERGIDICHETSGSGGSGSPRCTLPRSAHGA